MCLTCNRDTYIFSDVSAWTDIFSAIFMHTYFAVSVFSVNLFISGITACEPWLCFSFFTGIHFSFIPIIKHMKSDCKPVLFINCIFISLYVMIYLAIHSNIHDYLTVVQYILLLGPVNKPRQSSGKIVHYNVCSLLTKVDIIAAELANFDTCIITISETHLDSSIDNTFVISGFHPPMRLDRNGREGGVAMYISDEFVFYERDLQRNNLEIL